MCCVGVCLCMCVCVCGVHVVQPAMDIVPVREGSKDSTGKRCARFLM